MTPWRAGSGGSYIDRRLLRGPLLSLTTLFAVAAIEGGCQLVAGIDELELGDAGAGPRSDAAWWGGSASDHAAPGADDGPATLVDEASVEAGPGTTGAFDEGGVDVGAPIDAGAPEVPVLGVQCGSQTCLPGVEVCCFTFDAGPQGCATSCPSGQLALPCDDTADCVAAGHAGTLCCIAIGPSPDFHAQSVACRSSCSSQGQTPMCDPSVPSTCTSPDTCRVSTSNVPGYFVCK
jgi:hypothetical protein